MSEMTHDEFWTLVEQSRRDFNPNRRDGNMDLQLQRLEELLNELPVEVVRDYQRLFNELFAQAYRWDLWDAAYIINSGCSDDGFTDFRYWLISMGRASYEAALRDPESLAEIASSLGVEVCAFEEFGYVAQKVLENRGAADDLAAVDHPEEPAGERTDEASLPERFPKLWATFGTR